MMLSALRDRLRPTHEAELTSRYVGPSWENRRARVLERLGITVVLDVGANAGQYAVELRRHGYERRIVSLEPASDAFAQLRERCAQDQLWSAEQLALGSEPRTATLNIAGNEGKSSSLLPQREFSFGTTAAARYVDSEPVRVDTLETVGPRLVGADDRVYLKLDVQGLELSVIEGAGAFLPRTLAIEAELALFSLYEDQSDWRQVCDRLERAGFVLYALDPGYSDWESGRLVEMDGLFVREALARLR